MRDRDVQELENTLEVEYELGCILRDRIIPHALGWYLDVELDSEEEEVDDEDDEESQESNEEEDEESNEDDDDESLDEDTTRH